MLKTIKKDLVYRVHGRFNTPSASVAPGETFTVDTELNSGDWLHSIEDTWSLEKADGPNPTVVLNIEGATPGDMLAVHIRDIEPDSIGYTGFDTKANTLAHLISRRDWGLNTKTVKIEDGYVIWNDKIKIPVKPMIGTIGVAPEQEVIRNGSGGNYGGNMDVQEIRKGSTVYLPVFVEGALLHLGDVHAVQGDGEINKAGGIECRARLTLEVDVKRKFDHMNWIRAEDSEYIMTITCYRSVEESFYAAAEEMLHWISSEYNFSIEEAYLLMGELMEARCTQYVNPTRSYICKFPKKYLL